MLLRQNDECCRLSDSFHDLFCFIANMIGFLSFCFLPTRQLLASAQPLVWSTANSIPQFDVVFKGVYEKKLIFSGVRFLAPIESGIVYVV